MSARGWVGRSVSLGLLALSATCAKRENPSSVSTDASSAALPLASDTSASTAAGQVAPEALSALPPADAKTRAQCANICDRSRELHCKHPSECLPNCLAMQAATPCGQAFSAFYGCLVAEPTAHFECDEQSGVAQIRDGYCEGEQQAAFRCMDEKMKQ